jgi:DNA-binding transcriptional LysR family regulator
MQWSERIGRRVKLRDLHILLAVAQTGSMIRAANSLAISQPVISKTISDLEHALGVRLLDRTAQGVEPTAYGRAFINCGTVVFDELRRGVQAIEFLSDPTFGKLRIGGAAPFIDEMIPVVIARLADRYPRIEFHVTEGDTPTLCEFLRDRKLDLLIGRTSIDFGEDLVSDPLFEDHMFVVAGIDNPWSRRRSVELTALMDEPWVMPEADNLIWPLIEEGFRAAGLSSPAPQVVSNSMAIRTRLVETGRFLTILPGSTLHFGLRRLRMKVLPVALPIAARPVQVVTLRNRTPNPLAKLFIDELRIFARPLTTPRSGRRPKRAGPSTARGGPAIVGEGGRH